MNANVVYEAKGNNNKSQERSVQIVIHLTEHVYGDTHPPSRHRFNRRRLLTSITLNTAIAVALATNSAKETPPSTFSTMRVVLFLVASVAPIRVVGWAGLQFVRLPAGI